MNKFLLSLALAVGFGSAANAQTYEATAFADLQTGDVVAIVDTYGKYAIPNAKATSNGSVTAETIELSSDNNTVSATDMSKFLFTVSKTADGVTFKSNASTGTDTYYLYCIASNNGVRVGTTDADNVFTLDQNFLKNVGKSRYIGVYNNQDWRCYTSIHANIQKTKIAFYKETADASTVYKPSFTPAGGTYYEPQTVAIECATEGATIEYSLDEKATWTAYTSAITVDKTMTVYARATKDGVTAENSASYEIVTPTKYASFADMMTMTLPAKGQDSEVFTIDFDATVVYQSGKYTYLYDGKDYALYYLENPGLAQFNTLKAGWNAKITNYNNLYEVVPVTTPEKGEDVTALPTAEVVDASAITAENQAKYVTLKGVELTSATPATAAQFTGTAGGATVTFYNRFTLPEVAAGTYDVTGFIAVYNTTVQVYPTSFDEPAPTPVEPDYTLVLDWQKDLDANTNSIAENRFAAANPVTGEILVPNKASQIIYAITKDGITQKYDASGTALKISTAIGCDTKGNVVLGLGWPNSTMTKNLLLISADGSVKKEVNMVDVASDYSGGRVDFFGRILGDVMGEGGLLNVHASGASAIYGLKLANGAAAEVIASLDIDPTGYGNPSVCVPMGATYEEQVALGDEVGDMATPSYLYNRGDNMMYYDTETLEYAKHATYDNNKPSCYGFDTFMMDGVRYFVQSTGSGNYADGLVIYTLDADGNNKAVASYDLAAASLASTNYVSLNAYPRANGKTVDIYQFTAGKYARHFIFGEQPVAIEVAAPTFDPAPGEVAKGTEVTISCATEGAKLTITINNGDMIEADAPYTFAVNEATTVEAFAFVTSNGVTYDSEVVTAEYTVKADVPVAGKEYVLVTTEDNLKENANYVLYGVSTQKYSGVSHTSEAIMSTTINGGDTKPVFASIEKGETTFTLENGVLILADNVTDVALLQLEKGTEAGKWALKLGDKYLQGGYTTSNYMTLSDTPYWATITLDANGQAAIVFDKNPETSTNVNLLYNINYGSTGANPRFSCYKSTPNAQMAKPYLYLDKVNSGVENVDVNNDDNAPVEYYNLQGIRVTNPGAGQILIRRQGNKVTKVIL